MLLTIFLSHVMEVPEMINHFGSLVVRKYMPKEVGTAQRSLKGLLKS